MNQEYLNYNNRNDGKKIGAHQCPIDPLEDLEQIQGFELSGKMHALAEKPIKYLKRARDHKESYYHLHRK